MTTHPAILKHIVGHTAILTLNNPPANTWTADSLQALKHIVLELNQNKDVYALVITGQGDKFFSAGADLNLFADGDKDNAASMATHFGEAFEALSAFRGVSIAAINGYAMGGGLEVALACDLRIAEAQAQLALPEASVGLLPCAGGTQNLTALVGEGWAKRMILCGERIDAAKAEKIGLVEEVVEQGHVLDAAVALAAKVAKQSPSSVSVCKTLIQAGRTMPRTQALPLERELFVGLFNTEDQAEGVKAFLQKRAPKLEELLMTQDVIFQTLGTLSGQSIGVVTLNIEKALNALTLDMVAAMQAQLTKWQQDDSIACVVLDGAGEKAFCAGGDVRAIYHASIANPNNMTTEACEFFTQEYQLDYLLHQFGKPVLVWGDGIVMGGGLGLMAGGSHRVVTERSRIAMPEVTIGLYPDVGGSYFLNRMPGKTGLFLGLTAYNMNCADALYVGLGNHLLNSDEKEPLFDAMAELAWSQDSEINHQLLSGLLTNMSQPHLAALSVSQLQQFQAQIDLLMAGDILDVHHQLSTLNTELDWLKRAQKTALAGSPISWHLIFAQAELGTELSLADCFKWELGVSVNCCSMGDFCEGVRALLIDKDRQPKWLFADVDAVDANKVTQLVTSPWAEDRHPLADFT